MCSFKILWPFLCAYVVNLRLCVCVKEHKHVWVSGTVLYIAVVICSLN